MTGDQREPERPKWRISLCKKPGRMQERRTVTWPASLAIEQALSSEGPQLFSQISTHAQRLVPSRAAAPPPWSPCKRLPRALRVWGKEPRVQNSAPSACSPTLPPQCTHTSTVHLPDPEHSGRPLTLYSPQYLICKMPALL